uniref:cGMP-dependent protein kinase n=1 Tax=Phaeomonas parva TaxID=124430 RepID=A0A7S1UKI4_9STRA|mmetsp:Transcript_9108/g.26581  ORF Transcript_9108/g.26581 Transcript_9108/m.26581 type:complete len:1085 (+) Transcript_9108:280-3534(+)
MGCNTSKARVQHSSTTGGDKKGPLSEKEIQERIVESKKTNTLVIQTAKANFVARHAHVSQRGYYPHDLTKANQDAFCVETKFMGNDALHFFGVFDGHGPFGDFCAKFVKIRLPEVLSDFLMTKEETAGPVIDMKNDALHDTIMNAFVNTNNALHRSTINDDLSGTTAITVLMRGDHITVCNVGDSRAIIGVQSDKGGEGFVRASPLSIDQTPFRKDERERVKEAGARVMTMDQIDGVEPMHENWGVELGEEVDESGDPPRVWNSTLDRPGCAFTRSFGDVVAEGLGVYAVPEIETRALTEHDKYIVIASDGVFEFMTSQSVMDMVVKIGDPLEACQAVVAEAYRLWLQYEIRTDDITVICINLSDMTFANASVPQQSPPETATLNYDSKSITQRPVRRHFAKQKRLYIQETRNQMEEDGVSFDVAANVVPKSDEETQRIRDMVSATFLFSHLSESQWSDVLAVFKRQYVKEGQDVITQGDEGDIFYVVDSGTFSVFVATEDVQKGGGEPEKVFEYSRAGDTFGELSLMYGKPRAATVRANEDGMLWGLSREAFRYILMRTVPRRGLIKVLRSVDIFKPLIYVQLQRMCDLLTEETYEDGQYIVRQGETGKEFYIVETGAVSCRVAQDGGEEREVLRVSPNGYFGERALMYDEPRAASVVAAGKTTVLVMARRAFMEVKGDLRLILEEDQQRRENQNGLATGDDVASADGGNEGNNDFEVNENWTPRRVASSQEAYSAQLERQDTVIQERNSGCSNVNGTILDMAELEEIHGIWSDHNVALAVGNCHRLKRNVSIKAAVKGDAHALQMLVNERQLLRDMMLYSARIPMVASAFHDDIGAYLVFKDEVVCTLSQLIALEPLSESRAKFFTANILLALDVLQKEGVVLRNLSAEHVAILDNGYPQLHNFCNAKVLDGNKCFTMCGNPCYWPPEMVSRKGHDHTLDLWSLGVLIYEMLSGKTPFEVTNDNGELQEPQTYEKITKHADAADIEWPGDKFSTQIRSLIGNLLMPEPADRIGANGMPPLRKQTWLSGLSWQDYKEEAVELTDFNMNEMLTQIEYMPDDQLEEVFHNSVPQAPGAADMLSDF